MPSDSIAGFLDHAKANRVLFPEQVEQLIRQPDVPQSGLNELCSYLLDRGVLTQFQSNAIRDGRGQELNFGGYPIIDEIGPCPGGIAYHALHPALRTPVILRRFQSDAFGPADSALAVVNRARVFGTIHHPNLHTLLDAGVYQGQAYAVLDQHTDAEDLGILFNEIGGAMPDFLAAEYGWSLAAALRVMHERGGWHGDVRPGLILIGPLTVKTNAEGITRRRPAPNASVKLTEVGLIPVRPPASVVMPSPDALTYLPPERIDGTHYDPRGDIYSLGATLYFLLTGRPVFTADTPEQMLNKIRISEPVSVAALRPDVHPAMAAVVMRMLAKRLELRPQTAFEVEAELARFCRPGIVPIAPPPVVVPVAQAMPTVHPIGIPPAPEPDEEWGVSASALADAQAASSADTTQPRRRQLSAKDKSRSKMWIAIGLCLHLSAVGLLIGWATGVFDPSPQPEPAQPIEKKEDKKPPKKQRGAKS